MPVIGTAKGIIHPLAVPDIKIYLLQTELITITLETLPAGLLLNLYFVVWNFQLF